MIARALILGGVVALLTAASSAAQTLAPSTILANTAAYEGKAVTVTGTVGHLQKNRTMFRTVTGFQLCDTKCVVVIDEKNAPYTNGQKATVSGTFQSTFKGPKRSFDNVVLIH